MSQKFTMPVSGSFRVALLSIQDGSIQAIPGTRFDFSVCTDAETRPYIDLTKYSNDSPEMDAYHKILSAYNSRQNKCVLDTRFGVIEIELKNINNNNVDKRLSSNMYHVNMMPSVGTIIADFRRFKKGTDFHITVRSSLSDSHIDRERLPFKVMIRPNQIKCSALKAVVGGDPENCAN